MGDAVVDEYRSDRARILYGISLAFICASALLAVTYALNDRLDVTLPAIATAGLWAYWAGWRVAYGLRVEGDELVWKAPFRSGRVPRSAIETFRDRDLIGVLVCRAHRNISVWKGSGLRRFFDVSVCLN